MSYVWCFSLYKVVIALYLLTNLSLIIVTHAVGLPSIRVGASFISYHCARSVALAFRCRPSVS